MVVFVRVFVHQSRDLLRDESHQKNRDTARVEQGAHVGESTLRKERMGVPPSTQSKEKYGKGKKQLEWRVECADLEDNQQKA